MYCHRFIFIFHFQLWEEHRDSSYIKHLQEVPVTFTAVMIKDRSQPDNPCNALCVDAAYRALSCATYQ